MFHCWRSFESPILSFRKCVFLNGSWALASMTATIFSNLWSTVTYPTYTNNIHFFLDALKNYDNILQQPSLVGFGRKFKKKKIDFFFLLSYSSPVKILYFCSLFPTYISRPSQIRSVESLKVDLKTLSKYSIRNNLSK